MASSIDGLHGFLRSRRSIRRFRAEPVPVASLERILTTATFAPSAHNRQPWRFAVVKDSSAKSRLADAMAVDFRRDLERDGLSEAEVESRVENSRSRIKSVPLLIILCMDTSEMEAYSDLRRADAERVMAIQSTANAGLALLLGAHAEGLAGVWSCAPLFAPLVVKANLDLPETWEPQAMFLLGYPVHIPEPPARKPVHEISIFA
jgi:coenzyme F420-0:L-glutamate ligase/coenzyme F420-1:gamma-L-glutamate ligase